MYRMYRLCFASQTLDTLVFQCSYTLVKAWAERFTHTQSIRLDSILYIYFSLLCFVDRLYGKGLNELTGQRVHTLLMYR